MPLSLEEVHARARRVRLLLLDVDGVLTDGTVGIHSDGSESKSFFIRDGLGIVLARQEGIEVGLLSGRPSTVTTRRAAELRLTIVVQDGTDKAGGFDKILAAQPYAEDEVAYMGDDLLDLPVLRRVGLAASPADATSDVQAVVHWISRYPGGRGAVRELVELILTVQGRWAGAQRAHLA
jgi:3-deoxy-D-manno-octulosonate 8-phosphate phosphatase (KDO 8-P phosphatase)